MTPYMTVDQLAARMQVKRRTVLEWVREKRIPVLRAGPKVMRFDADAVARALTIGPRRSGNRAVDSSAMQVRQDGGTRS